MTALLVFPAGAALGAQLFGDVPDTHPFRFDIAAIAEAGVTTGCGGGNYCPSDLVTRGEMAAFMNRLGALGGDKVPVVNADRLDGMDGFTATALVNLSGVVDPEESRTTLGEISGLGSFTTGGAILGPGGDCDITFTNTSGASVVLDGNASAPIAHGGSIELTGTGTRPDGSSVTFSIATGNGGVVVWGQAVLLFGFPSAQNVDCMGSVRAVVSRG